MERAWEYSNDGACGGGRGVGRKRALSGARAVGRCSSLLQCCSQAKTAAAAFLLPFLAALFKPAQVPCVLLRRLPSAMNRAYLDCPLLLQSKGVEDSAQQSVSKRYLLCFVVWVSVDTVSVDTACSVDPGDGQQ